MKLRITVERYSYFDYNGRFNNKPKPFIVEGALKAWKAYKELKANDYNYDDAWCQTTYTVVHDDACDAINKHDSPEEANTTVSAAELADWSYPYEDDDLPF